MFEKLIKHFLGPYRYAAAATLEYAPLNGEKGAAQIKRTAHFREY